MTRTEWSALRRGDVIRSLAGTERVVLHGSGNGVELFMLRPSWRSLCPITTYVAYDRHRFTTTGRRVRRVPSIVCPLPSHRGVRAHHAR